MIGGAPRPDLPARPPEPPPTEVFLRDEVRRGERLKAIERSEARQQRLRALLRKLWPFGKSP
jgi:hypothetical protein